MEPVTDESLMLQARNGDLETLNVLFERYCGMLYSFFMKRTQEHSLSEDLTQEVFLRVLRYRASFKDDGNFKGWLFGIARNIQNRHWEKRYTKSEILHEDIGNEEAIEIVDARDQPDAEASRSGDTALLYQALERLSEEKRQIVIMRRIQNLSYIEMARILDCEANQLRVRVCRAVAELAKHMKSLIKERPYEMPGMQ